MRRSLTIVFGFIVAVFIFIGCQEPTLDKGEVKLKTLNTYSLNDFQLAKNVKYFEVVQYYPDHYKVSSSVLLQYGEKNSQKIKNVTSKNIGRKRYLTMYVKPIHDPSDPALISALVIGQLAAPLIPKVRIRYIEHNGKVGTVSDRAELKAFLGKIDTPAEIQLFHSLSGKHEAYSYKKTGESYRLRLNYIIYYSSTKRSVLVKSFVIMKP